MTTPDVSSLTQGGADHDLLRHAMNTAAELVALMEHEAERKESARPTEHWTPRYGPRPPRTDQATVDFEALERQTMQAIANLQAIAEYYQQRESGR